MSALSIDEYVSTLSLCRSADELYSAYTAEVQREGFQNVATARCFGREILEVPYLHVPEGAAHAYLEQNLADHDPTFRLVASRLPAFTFAEMQQADLSTKERRVLDACREIGCPGGFTIPIYGPSGMSDVIDLSYIEKAGVSPARLKIVAIKTYATWLHLRDLESVGESQRILATVGGADDAHPCAATSYTAHRDGHERITSKECRALVLCEIAFRRYRAGFTELNDGLEAAIGSYTFHRLRSRGLLLDVPDDDHWRFYYKPSPIAMAHLRRCDCVVAARDDAWRLNVRADERPKDWH